MNRRSVLKVAGAVSAAATALVAMPRLAMAAYSETAFKAKGSEDALSNLYGANATTPSDQVRLKAPDIAENGAVVPVEVETDMDAESIAVLIEKNPAPLALNADIPAGTQAMVKTRCRMGETTNVTAVVKSGGKLYTSTKEVKVTIGGCGG
jgi:sulfur-oxidizing protein SoxY